jgi:lipoate-protein ligase A
VAGWSTERVTGNAADFHARVPDAGAGRQAWWYAVEQPAIAIGSAQPVETIDMVACAQLGIEVVRRRSGGGAVLLLPGQILWLDVLIPLGDPLWDDDIGRSMWWFGEVWARSLRALGETEVAVHHGPLVPTAWSRTVCFDGLGSGEVVVGTAKAVGISQRRTRSWARLQSAVHVVWRPDVMVSLLSDPRPVVAELGPVWSVPVGREVGALVDAVDAALTAAE